LQGCCDSSIYTISTQRCQSDVVQYQCETSWYNPVTQYCYGNTVYNR
jgi:hypothetical protein